MTPDLFADEIHDVALAPGATLLAGFARSQDRRLIEAVAEVVALAPLRHMSTPGGHLMSVAMTNCGSLGWVTDGAGYRYDPCDPSTGRPWPRMPALFFDLAARAAARAGYDGFAADACLINRYEPGARLSLHQDKNERDFGQPIVSVSLGLPATFLFGGERRSDRPRRLPLSHGDVVVWGGESRFVYHGIATLAEGDHPATGPLRINLTFRKAR